FFSSIKANTTLLEVCTLRAEVFVVRGADWWRRRRSRKRSRSSWRPSCRRVGARAPKDGICVLTCSAGKGAGGRAARRAHAVSGSGRMCGRTCASCGAAHCLCAAIPYVTRAKLRPSDQEQREGLGEVRAGGGACCCGKLTRCDAGRSLWT